MSADQGVLIVTSGLPASGKTNLGRALAAELKLPFIDKDDILEVLFDTLGVASPDDRSRLSRASDAILQAVAGTTNGAVLASHWRRDELDQNSGTPTNWLRSRPEGNVIEVYCHCPPALAADRFIARTRHSGHFDDHKTLADLVARFESLSALGPWDLGPVVQVDTKEPVDVTLVARAVRKMTSHQVGARRLVVRHGRPGDVDTMTWARSEDQRDAWRHQLNRTSTDEVCFIVAEIDGRAVGKGVLDWVHNADGTPWLWMVSVDPEYRSQGIGTRILTVAERCAQERGHASIEMAVDDDNPRARALYLRNGYAVVGPHVDEYDTVQPDGSLVHVTTPGATLRKTFATEGRHP